jgi:hypothetical protein
MSSQTLPQQWGPDGVCTKYKSLNSQMEQPQSIGPTHPMDLRPLLQHSWLGCGSCPTPGGCHPDYKGPSASLTPDAYKTRLWTDNQLGSSQGLRRLHLSPCSPPPHLSVQTQGHGLVPESHEKVSSVQLILQVQQHCKHCEM